MKSLLLLASVLCLALIVSARPSDETPDQETSTELSEDSSADDTQEEEAVETDAESGADAGETEDDTGEQESSPGEEHSDDTVSEGDEGTEDTKDEDADGSEEEAAEEGAADEQGGAAEGEEESPRNTYNQVHKLLKTIMKVGTKDKYLKSFVLARLQERLMNPTIDLVSTIEKYSKIKECFSSLANDVSALVKESEKSYEECSKDKSNPSCGSEGTRDLDDGLIEREQELSNCIVDKRDSE